MRLSPFFLVPFLFLACDSDNENGEPAGTEEVSGGDVTDVNPPDDTAQETEAPTSDDISGTWALYEVQSVAVHNELIGAGIQKNHSFQIANIADGEISQVICDWWTIDGHGTKTTTLGDGVMAALDPYVRGYSVVEENGTFHFETERGVSLRGVKLEDAVAEEMPASAEDERVWDQDEDGQPGITINVLDPIVGQLYVAHRHQSQFVGKLITDDLIEGLTDWETEQVIFGSAPALITQFETESATDRKAENSYFTMKRVEDGMDCDGLNAISEELFSK